MENVRDHLNYFSYGALPGIIAEAAYCILWIMYYYKRYLFRSEENEDN